MDNKRFHVTAFKLCPICKTRPSRSYHAYCHACHAKNMRETRPKHSELDDEQRKKANSRAYANVYKRRGKLIPRPCEVCGDENVEMHHADYNKPLEIQWLCNKHHRIVHGGHHE